MILSRLELENLFPATWDGVTDPLWDVCLKSVDSLILSVVGVDDGTGNRVLNYTLLSEVDFSILLSIAIPVARHLLQSSLPYDEVKAKDVRARFEDALVRLDNIRIGIVKLPSLRAAQAAQGVVSPGTVNFTSNPPRGWDSVF